VRAEVVVIRVDDIVRIRTCCGDGSVIVRDRRCRIEDCWSGVWTVLRPGLGIDTVSELYGRRSLRAGADDSVSGAFRLRVWVWAPFREAAGIVGQGEGAGHGDDT
jgi:hypothetical protein